MSDEVLARLTDIEVALAHDRRMIEDLNDALITANKEVAQLTRRVGELEKMVAGVAEQVAGTPSNEKPPHY